MKRFLMLLILFLFSCGGTIGSSTEMMPTPSSGFPKNLSWGVIDTNKDGIMENYITPIKAQPCKDCYIYGAVALLEIQYQIDHGITDFSLDLSEQSMHNCYRVACDALGDYRPFLDHFKNYGVLEEKYAKRGLWGSCESCRSHLHNGTDYFPIDSIPFYRVGEWRNVIYFNMNYTDRKNALVAALQTGPVIIYVGGWNGYKKDGNIMYCSKVAGGGHIIVAVGYRNHGEAFLIKNSHGEKGVLKMAFKNGEKCRFADVASQIVPGTTYISYGSGEDFCYSTQDFDGDSVPDVHDNCPYHQNEDQKNTDGDMLGDACDPCPTKWNGNTGFYC